MGVPWSIQFYANDDQTALDVSDRVFARIKELDQIHSDYDPDSELNRLCRDSRPGNPVKVSPELLTVLQASVKLAQQSDGHFDVTVGPITELWRKSWRRRTFPEATALQAALAKIGPGLIVIDACRGTVELQQPGMQLDLGGIAKGFAADEAVREFARHGLTRVLVDASGDLVAGEAPPDQAYWRIEIEPLKQPAESRQAVPKLPLLPLKNGAVATSGDANRFVEIDGVRYSHLVNPHTGLGLTTLSSVTVLAETGLKADALASAVSVLGPERGLKLLQQTGGEACILLATPEGIRLLKSPGFDRSARMTESQRE